ncbi:MAG: prolipoprotein diacylglyceryl transferase, partial [Bacteroidales bacterium]|nr:prolipoprotein diacylglyceryl transferase [Bacteroidales bacterium]
MKIAVSDPGLWFAAFYVLAFLVTLAAVVIFSVRRRIELWPVLIMLTIMSMMTVLGSRLFTIPFSEWGRLIITGSFDGYSGRSAIGGLLFGLAGFVFSIRFLRIGMPVVNLFAWLTPIGFGIQKIGCFLNGCCYGEITSLPWGVRYSTGANAHFSQWSEGIIANDAA